MANFRTINDIVEFQYRPKNPNGVFPRNDRSRRVGFQESISTFDLDFNPTKRGAISNLGVVDYTAREQNELIGYNPSAPDNVSLTFSENLATFAEELFFNTGILGAALSNFLFQVSLSQNIIEISDELSLLKEATNNLADLRNSPEYSEFDVQQQVNRVIASVNSIERSVSKSSTTDDIDPNTLSFAEDAYQQLDLRVLQEVDNFPVLDQFSGGPGRG